MNARVTSVSLAILCLACIPGYGQKPAAVRASGRAQKNQIMIRWAVTDARAWKLSNQYGFQVTRYTVTRNKAMLATPERKDLGLFKPASLDGWSGAAAQDEYAAIIAQALYGERFEVTGAGDNGILSAIHQADEAEQRFILSLYAADRSFNAALLAGWGLADPDIRQNEKYLYRIRPAVPPHLLHVDSTAVFIGPEDFQPLPAATDLSAFFSDKSAMLSWNYDALKDHYNAYHIERSSDGTNFYRVTQRPVMRMAEPEQQQATGKIYYIDTLGMNKVTYYYRVMGITPFGENGPPSPVVSGIGKKILAYVPHITHAATGNDGNLAVSWEFDNEGNDLIKGFTLNQSESVQGPYAPVMTINNPVRRSATYDKLLPTNYFTITAEALDGESRTSMPVLVQPLDTVPPAVPMVTGVHIDSAGIVTVRWAANTDKDLLGYKIFRAYIKNAELTPVTDTVYAGTSFTDTVSMRMTNRKVYYAVTALDKRYNQSTFSPRVVALKPDVVAPTTPLFTRYELVDYLVKLTWADAHDADVAAHALYRKTNTEKSWTLLKKFGPVTPGAYLDNTVQRGHAYAYTLTSRDSSGLESPPARPVQLNITADPADLNVNLFSAYADRTRHHIELYWTDALKNAEEYHLYKKKKGETATLWKIIKSGEKRVVDDQLAINTEYTYGIRVVSHTGATSRVKWVVVQY